MPQHNDTLRTIAHDYNKQYGLPEIVDGHYVQVDTELAKEIARAYTALPVVTYDDETQHAYSELAVEVRQQWDVVARYYVLEPWQQEGQPYANSEEMRRDVAENFHLYFFTGGEVHLFLGQDSGIVVNGIALTYTDLFRAVHDIFGHATEGYQFGPRGEENAWIHHSMMFTSAAQRALTSETRGQNSWVNFGPHSALPVSERPFAKQKVALLPEEYCDWKAALSRS